MPYRPAVRARLHFASVLLGLVASHASARPLYGPGPHWLDKVRSGYAAFGAHATVSVDLNFDGDADLAVEMTGGTEVFRSDARAGDPARAPRHRNHVDLEIVTMHLAGDVPGLGLLTFDTGDGVGNQAPDGPLYAQGGSDEIAGDPRRSADFFDLFAEVRLGALRLHNTTPMRVVAVIDRLPPIGTTFTLSGGPVPFVDDSGKPVLQVTAATDVPTPPEPGACAPAGTDGLTIGALRADAALRCACAGHRVTRCAHRAIAAHVRSGQLNRDCRPILRRCLPSAICGGGGVAACGLVSPGNLP